jgi:hypothetical protein
MMKIKHVVIVFLCVVLAGSAQAQNKEAMPYKRIFVELGGAGLIYSFNYDFRFDSTNLQSWGMRIGAGGYFRNDTNDYGSKSGVLTIPVQFTRLLGGNRNFFEIGGGTTFVYARSTDNYYDYYTPNPNQNLRTRKDFDFILNTGNTPALMGTLNFGYRHVPVDGGFSFSANLTPIFNHKGFWPLWFGIGLGYSFK